MYPVFLFGSQISVQITAVNQVSKTCFCPRHIGFYTHRLNALHIWSRSDAFLEALAIVSQAVNDIHAWAAIPGFPQSSSFSVCTYSSCAAHLQAMHAVMADGVGKNPSWNWSGLSGTINWAHGLLLVYSCTCQHHELCQESLGGNFMVETPRLHGAEAEVLVVHTSASNVTSVAIIQKSSPFTTVW